MKQRTPADTSGGGTPQRATPADAGLCVAAVARWDVGLVSFTGDRVARCDNAQERRELLDRATAQPVATFKQRAERAERAERALSTILVSRPRRG